MIPKQLRVKFIPKVIFLLFLAYVKYHELTTVAKVPRVHYSQRFDRLGPLGGFGHRVACPPVCR